MGNSSPKLLANAPVVLIVGGGPGGVSVARALDKTGEFNVILLDRKNYFLHNIGGLRATVDPAFARQILIPYDKLLKHGSVITAEVTEISPSGVRVHGREEPITFDYLVIATGSSYAFPGKIAETRKADAENKYIEVNKAINNATHITIVGGGPVGVELAGEIAVEFKGAKPVTLIHSRSTLLPDEMNAALKEKMLGQLQQLGVQVVLGERVLLDDKEDEKDEKTVSELYYRTGPTVVRTDKGKQISADIIFDCRGVKVNNRSFAASLQGHLNRHGRLTVEKTLQVRGLTGNIFALGDCAGTAPQMAFVAAKQAEVVAQNIRLLHRKQPLKEFGELAPAMFVTLGRTGGAGQLPNKKGTVVGNRIVGMLKSKTLFVSNSWKMLNAKQPKYADNKVNPVAEAHPPTPTSPSPAELVRSRNLSNGMKLTEEEALLLMKVGLPEPPREVGADHS